MAKAVPALCEAPARDGSRDRGLVTDREPQHGREIRRIDPRRTVGLREADVAGPQDRAARAPVADVQGRGRLHVRVAEYVLCAFGRHEGQVTCPDPA
jgi:hypothetical protein